MLLSGHNLRGWIADDASWSVFLVRLAYRLTRLLCPRFPQSTKLRLHIHGGSSQVTLQALQDGSCGAFVELFDHVKVEFSFDDEHTQGRGCWVLTDLYILKFNLVSKSSHLGCCQGGT